MDECIHGLGPVDACVICNGRAAREEARNPSPAHRVFAAKWVGWCDECDSAIFVGEMISWAPDERPTHEGCA